MGPLEFSDLVGMAEGEANVVEAVEQAVAAKGFNFKPEVEAEVVRQRAILKVGRQGIVRACGGDGDPERRRAAGRDG